MWGYVRQDGDETGQDEKDVQPKYGSRRITRPQGDKDGDHRPRQYTIIQNKSKANLLSLRLT